jgi:flagellar hook-length control protein FliK
MSIEVSPPSTEPHKTGASSSASAGKGKGKADSHGGFDAILGALDDSSSAASSSTPGLVATDASKNAPAVGAEVDASTLLAQNPQISLLLPATAAALLAPTPAKADGDLAASAGSVLGAGKGKSGSALGGVKPGDLQADAGDGSAKALSTSAAHARTAQMATAAADASGNSSANAAATDPSATTANSPSDAKDAKLAVAMEFMKAVQAAPVTDQPTATTAIAKPEKSTGDRISAASQNTDASTYAASSVGVSSSFSDNATASGGVAATPEAQVAEQVKYWMSNDVQNAELKLDGLGKDPVQVSISMTGNEAHIVFRTDESQARGVLEGAAAHLKDMLGREGVVLTGVSVGTSGSQSDSGGGDRRPRQGVRQAFVTSAIGAVASAGSRTAAPSGRALDLFV